MIKAALNWIRNVLNFELRYPWVRYGRNVHVQWSTRIWSPHRHVIFGDNVGVGYNCDINTDVEIGNNVLVASRVGFVSRDAHSIDVVGTSIFRAPRGDKLRIVVEDDVWIGWGAVILSGVRIGRGSVVAAGSVVTKDVPQYAIVAPPRSDVIRMRFSADEISRHEAALYGK